MCAAIFRRRARALLAMGALLLATAAFADSPQGFVPLFDGSTLQGWKAVGGSADGYVAQDGTLRSTTRTHANLFTEQEFSDFALRFEFKLAEGANSGIGIRAPYEGRTSRVGMEIQILDDASPRYTRLKATQYHGSIYEVVAAKRGALKPTGEWNEEEIMAVGRQVRVTLNDQVIVDANLDDVKDEATLGLHPGLQRTGGHIGILGHGSEVAFRNILVKDLAKAAATEKLAGAEKAVFALTAAPAAKASQEYAVTVSAPNHAYLEAPVAVTVDAPRGSAAVTVWQGAKMVPSQAHWEGDRAHVTWMVRDLKQGGTVRYRLAFEKDARPLPAAGVRIVRSGENLDIRVNDELFTRYDTTTGPNKPYFYPINGPGGKRITRHYPLETVAGESRDHPHHRGMWFTHFVVNGVDYWSEGPRAGKTVHRKYEGIESGPVYGAFRAVTDWIAPDGKKPLEDVRDVRVYNIPEGRLMDIAVAVRATEGPVTFGDEKDGLFGLRVADTMRVKGGMGHIEMSTGIKDGDAWGKRADWVDYYGPVDGATVGVAIFDHPQNLRHPTWWHARDYGLFTANPFGIHDFEGKPAKTGDYTLPAGETITFRYRLLFHNGTTAEAHIADVWNAYADPPRVEIQPSVTR
jgi:Family of unknown function (DUF6807)/3-keto-disaccharide hydrolase